MDGSARTPSLDELLDQERWLQALARRLVRDAATADDLVQETWFRTLAARRDPRPGSGTRATDARAWLGHVLRNVWRERGRSERARSGREARVSVVEAGPSARESLERFELQQRLAALVLELDEPFRSVVIWRYHEGRSAAAIATELGEPAARVRWRLMRARELLRQRLDRDRHDWTERFALFLPFAQRSAPTSPVVAGAAGLGALSIGIKPLLWVGAGVLLVWTLARLGAPGSPGRPSGPDTPGDTLLASEEAARVEERAPAAPESAQRAPVPAFVTPPAGAEQIALGPGAALGRVRGVVKAAEVGNTLEGAELAFFKPGGSVLNGTRTNAADSFGTRSDAEGSFLIADVEPGVYEVFCRLEGRRPLRLPEFELAAGEETVLEIALELGFPVTVEVTERASGAPVAGALVELIAGDHGTVVWFSPDDLRFHTLSGITSRQGRVELGGASRGTYQYAVKAPEYATALGETLVESAAAPLRIRLEHGGVRHANGLPVEGARVFLNPVVYVRGLDELVFRQNGLATDRDGAYRLEGVPEGVYYAVALLPDGSGSFYFDPEVRNERDLGRIVVEDSVEVSLDFDLPVPGRMRGLVRDTAGAAVPGATVSVSWGDFKPGMASFFPIASVPGVKESIHHSRRTDAEGRFEIDTLRSSHRKLEFRFSCAGFVEEKLALDVPPRALLEPVVTLRRLGATITGRLTDADGAPVAGQTVGAFEADGEMLGDFFQSQSAADGTYVLQLPHESSSSGRHRVYPILWDSSPLCSEPERREGVPTGASGIDFVLRAKQRLHGTVVDDSGSIVRDFLVHGLERVPGAADRWKALDDANRGEGRFDLFVGGQLTELRFSAPGCDPASLTDLADDGERRLVLRRAADLLGVVLDGEGRGVAGAVVALATLDSAIYPAGTGFAPRDTTDAEGRFRLRGVPDPFASAAALPPADTGHLLVCPRRDDAPPLLHYPLPAQRGASLELVLPRCMLVELEFADASGNPIEGNVLVIDPEGWPLEPAFETHLSDQEDPERGLLSDGRTRFRLRPGPHHAILIRGAEAREALPFEVADDDGTGPAIQERSFTVGFER